VCYYIQYEFFTHVYCLLVCVYVHYNIIRAYNVYTWFTPPCLIVPLLIRLHTTSTTTTTTTSTTSTTTTTTISITTYQFPVKPTPPLCTSKNLRNSLQLLRRRLLFYILKHAPHTHKIKIYHCWVAVVVTTPCFKY